MRKKVNLYSIILWFVVTVASTAYGANYTFTTIDVPGALTVAQGINNSGNIVGWYTDFTGTHGFLDVLGTITPINYPGALQTYAYGINDSGNIVGTYYSTVGTFHGFLDDHGTMTTIDVPGSTSTAVYGINDSGSIVGYYTDYSGYNRGFLETGTLITNIYYPYYNSLSYPYGINSSENIVGWYSDGISTHGYLNTGGIYTTFDFPGALSTFAYGINDSANIVGWFFGGHGYLDIGGTFTSIDVPGASLTSPYGINNSGDIVGWYTDPTGGHGFEASPAIPEPATMLLLGSGLLGLGVYGRKKFLRK